MRPRRSRRESVRDGGMQSASQDGQQIIDSDMRSEGENLWNGRSEEERREKEQRVFDAIKDEYIALIDQLPLALQREMSLVRELDQQVQGYYEDLLPTLRKYIAKRLHLTEPLELPSFTAQLLSTPPSTPQKLALKTPLQRLKSTISLTSPHTPGTPMGLPKERLEPPKTNVDMLSHIAFLSDEIVRASEEKVYLAQSSCNAIERYQRLLDQAIKEEEAALSVGARPGTHVPPIILPEVVQPSTKPQGSRQSNPFVDSDDDLDSEHPLEAVITEPASQPDYTDPTSTSKRKKGRQKSNAADEGEKLTIRVPAKLPPAQVTVEPTDLGANVDATPYCFCRQPSFGVMIMCDEPGCHYEWFHLSCVQLTEPPPEDKKWFCHECLARGAGKDSKPKSKKKRRR